MSTKAKENGQMTAEDVRAALRSRWPDAEYLTIAEAPDGPARLGRKLDAVVVSLWRSRGYELDGVEIKVSTSDWMREVNDAAKADFWWRHVHRFWVAVPVAIAPKVRETLPSGWGLLATQELTSKVVVQATKHQPEPLGWEHCIGLMRAACNAGVGALQRAEHRGYDLGYQRAKAEVTAASGDDRLSNALKTLQGQVAAFKAACGIDVGGTWSAEGAADLGRLVALVQAYSNDGAMMGRRLRVTATQFAQESARLAVLADNLDAALSSPDLVEKGG